MLDSVSGAGLGFTTADGAGNYVLSNLPAGSGGFLVRAATSQSPNITATQSGIFIANGDHVTVNLTLPASTLQGQAFFPKSTPVLGEPLGGGDECGLLNWLCGAPIVDVDSAYNPGPSLETSVGISMSQAVTLSRSVLAANGEQR
jgi:hypothetical protein